MDAHVCVVSDDKDVFSVLYYHNNKSSSTGPLMMEPSVDDRIRIDIPETVKKHSTFTVCDTVAASYGIDKLKAVATSKKRLVLDSLSVIDAPWNDMEKEANHFMVNAYGGLCVTIKSTLRICTVYAARTRTRSPLLLPREFGWEADEINKSHSATTVAQGVCLAPDFLLKVIHCDCDSESSCKQQEWELWVHGSPIPMHNILLLLGWAFMS